MEENGVPILGAAADAAEQGLARVGVICTGCGRDAAHSLDGKPTMWEYLFINPPEVRGNGKAVVQMARSYACGREDCDAEEKMKLGGALARRRMPAWELIEPPAPPEQLT